MLPFENRHHRRSIRIPGYDYSQAGAYFVTIVSHKREHLFGDIQNGEMILNPFGKIVAEEWIKTPVVRPTIELSEYVIMPNHIHGIIIIRSDNTVGATRRVAPTTTRRVTPTTTRRVARPQTIPNGPTSGSIGAIIGQIKSLTTKRINAIRDTPGISVWQRNYYEHIIRSETELNRICAYITANPINWEKDRENQA